ncbi:MAG TPA: hypothetical protein VFW07_16630 [Parafilimonas sp.]|nr:hypothetical protein [Parafilimonas sp.]
MVKIAGTVVFSLAGITFFMLLYNSSKDNQQLNKQLGELKQKVKLLENSQQTLLRENTKLQSIISFQRYRNSAQSQIPLQHTTGDNLQPPSYFSGVMETLIDGAFDGWDGETIFKMMNGTVWQQAEYSCMYQYAYMPEVLIYEKGDGYYMKVEDVDEEIRVTQVK